MSTEDIIEKALLGHSLTHRTKEEGEQPNEHSQTEVCELCGQKTNIKLLGYPLCEHCKFRLIKSYLHSVAIGGLIALADFVEQKIKQGGMRE